MNLRISLVCLLAAVGCSSSNFEIADTTDSATSDETASDTGIGPVEDAEPPADSNSEEVIAVDGGSGCAAPSNPLEIWVDGATSATSATGTAACPFHRVSEAIAYANTLPLTTPRTIRVKPGVYVEDAAIILRKGLTLTGSGVGVTQLSGGGLCTSSTTGYKCVVRVDSGAILERVSIDASPNGKHGVVTGEAEGTFPIVRSTAISGAGGSCCSGILVNSGAILGPNIESSKNAYGLTIWGSQTVKVLAGTNKFDNNTLTGINHEGTGVFSFEGGSVSNNREGIKLGDLYTATPPANSIKNLIALKNIEYGVKVTNVASAIIRSSTITGSKFGVIAIYGASNFIELGTAGVFGGNNFGSPTARNSLGGLCALFTKAVPLDATGNTFPDCAEPRSLDDISTTALCEAVTTYADVWYRGAQAPLLASCTKGM
jgi:hypothetical protein